MQLTVVMDNNAGTKMLVSQVLKKDSHDVMAADNGCEGLALIMRYRPDRVVSDI